MNIADVVLIIIVGLCTFIGIRTGLVRTAIRFGAVFLSIFIALIIYPMFSEMFLSSEMANSLSETINTEYVLPYINNMLEGSLGELNEANGVLGIISKNADMQAASAAEVLSDRITAIFVNVVTFLIIMILCRIAFAVISKLLIGVSEFPVLKQLNAFAGGIIGLLQGILICYLIITAVSAIAAVNPSIKNIDESIQNSAIASYMYNNNFILNSLSSDK